MKICCRNIFFGFQHFLNLGQFRGATFQWLTGQLQTILTDDEWTNCCNFTMIMSSNIRHMSISDCRRNKIWQVQVKLSIQQLQSLSRTNFHHGKLILTGKVNCYEFLHNQYFHLYHQPQQGMHPGRRLVSNVLLVLRA